MERFKYRAINASGASLEGELDALNDRDALNQLAQQSLTPLSIQTLSKESLSNQSKANSAKRASQEDVALVLQELGTLVSAGVPLAEAAQSLAESHGHTQIGTVFTDVRRRLGAGETLSTALQSACKEQRITLPEYVEPLVRASEATGELGNALASASQQMLSDVRLREETISALIYPVILVVVGIVITLYIFMQVVPNFAPILKNTRAQGPEFSRFIITMGVWLKVNAIWIFGTLAALSVITISGLRQRSVRESTFEWLADKPVIGPWLIASQVSRWASVFGALIQSKVPIVQAMELAQATLAVPNIRRKLDIARKSLRQGERLALVLAPTGLLRPTALNLIRVGEASSELGKMLQAVAKLEGDTANERRKRLLALIEPIAILFIGIAVGTIMYSIISAMTSLSPVGIK